MDPLIRVGAYLIVTVLLVITLSRKRSHPIATKKPLSYLDRDVFTYTVLRAEDPKDQDTNMGVVQYEDFVTAFESFPWNEQIQKASALKVQSPTLTIKDELSKKAYAISMSGQPDNSSVGVGYIVAYIFKDTSNKDVLFVRETQNKQAVLLLTKKFFARDTDMQVAFKKLN